MKWRPDGTPISEAAVRISTPVGVVEGALALPASPSGVVVFAHGSGSSRHSPRNRRVAQSLQRRGFGTLLMDLLTLEEAEADAATAEHRFDIDSLAARLTLASDWVRSQRSTEMLPVGYFGASTGAAAALVAAAQHEGVEAVVSRGGRPDLAGDSLPQVTAATLLIVGARDFGVIELNEQAYARLTRARAKQISTVTGATHLFEEPGALENVSELAGAWFERHLRAVPRAE